MGANVDNKRGLGASKGRYDAMSPMLSLHHGLGFHLKDAITQGGERGRDTCQSKEKDGTPYRALPWFGRWIDGC
jgi:hypothetical protein